MTFLLHRAGCLLIALVYCQDGDSAVVDLEPSNEPDFKVELSVDTQSRLAAIAGKQDIDSVTDSTTAIGTTDRFTCHACTDCQSPSELTTEVCQAGVQMCYVSRSLDFVYHRFSRLDGASTCGEHRSNRTSWLFSIERAMYCSTR